MAVWVRTLYFNIYPELKYNAYLFAIVAFCFH